MVRRQYIATQGLRNPRVPTFAHFHRWSSGLSREDFRFDGDQGEIHIVGYICFFLSSTPQVVLSVILRNYTFEFPDGPSTKIEWFPGLLQRPKVAGQEGPEVSLIFRRVE